MKTSLLFAAILLPLAALAQSPVPDAAEKVTPLAVGSKAPKVNVKTIEGKSLSLPKLLAAQPTVLIFYRGGWCPFCNRQMSGLQSIEGDLKKLGYRIIALSPDRQEELKKSLGKNKLTYQLLSDSSMEAAKAFGVAFRVDDGTLAKYKGFGIDLEAASGQKHHYLPVPSVFLIGTDGVIKFRSFNPDYKVRLSSEELLSAARQNPAK
jgi:peroxiredoxin